MKPHFSASSLSLALLLLAPAVHAQELQTLLPPSAPFLSYFSSAIAVSNDLVLTSNYKHGPKKQGRVEVYDLHTGEHLRFLRPTEVVPQNMFGGAIAMTADWTLIESRKANVDDQNSGAVYLFDPSTGEELRKFVAPDGLHGQWFGASLAIDGDLALIGAPGDDTKEYNSGAAYLIHIPTGALVHKLIGSDSRKGSYFGGRLALGSGRAVVASSNDNLWTGAAYVFDLATGQELYKLRGSGTHKQASFGFSVKIQGDRILVGAPSEDNLGIDRSGAAYIFDLHTGAELHRFASPHANLRSGFGWRVLFEEDFIAITELGDVNLFSTKGRVFLYDAHTYELLETVQPSDNQEGDLFGMSIASQGCEVVIGSPWADSIGEYTGKAYTFALPSAIGASTCEANRNSTGDPALLTAAGSLCVATNNMTLSADTMPPGVPGSFLVSQAAAFVPFVGGSQGNLCLAGPVGRFTDPPFVTSPAGTASLRVDLTDIPLGGHEVQPGETWYFQAWFRDNNPGPTSNLTDGLELTFR
jgi:FG-GAP repeat protein